MTQQQRQVQYLRLTELEHDERNPKSHDLNTIDMSMQRFGVLDPIVVDGRTDKIISGHGRHKTLLEMFQRGDDAPDGVEVTDDGDWLIPVYTGWRSQNDSEASAALIALNRTTELGGWVDEELIELLTELAEDDDAGLEGVGFVADDIEKLQAKLDALDEDDDDDDAIENDNVADSVSYAEKFELVIDCEDEHDQEIKYQQLVEAGFTPRALSL